VHSLSVSADDAPHPHEGGEAVLFMSHDVVMGDHGSIRSAVSRFWCWLRETVTGHETRSGDEAIPYVPCYYDD
jgi:hypothetical protein